MLKKAVTKLITLIMRRRGYSDYYALEVLNARLDDFLHNHHFTLRQKIWAQRRGFLSERISHYGLTEDNYRDYLDDFSYYKMFPVNGYFSHLIDDKLTIRYILESFREHLPEYYWLLSAGRVLKLPDAPAGEANLDRILTWLEERVALALKPVAGGGGRGFYKLSFDGQQYFINNVPASIEQVRELLGCSHHYLVTEYLSAHPDIRRYNEGSANTVRVLVLNEDGAQPVIADAYLKLGTRRSGVVDNTHAGGLFINVDLETGHYDEPVTVLDYQLVKFAGHPDTGETVEGILPHWEMVKEKLLAIGRYLPQLKQMGFDLVITESGFKITEINSQPGIGNQRSRPFLKVEPAASFYRILRDKV